MFFVKNQIIHLKQLRYAVQHSVLQVYNYAFMSYLQITIHSCL